MDAPLAIGAEHAEKEREDMLFQGRFGTVCRVRKNENKNEDVWIRKKAGYVWQAGIAHVQRDFNILNWLYDTYGPHPGIPRVLRCYKNAQHETCMDMQDGGTDLLDVLESNKPYNGKEIMEQIMEALRFIHRCGVAHRDLKPENITVDDKGHVMLIDFGFAIQAKFAQGEIGTNAYAAPETLSGHEYNTFQADCWSMGAVAFAIAYKRGAFSPSDNIILDAFRALTPATPFIAFRRNIHRFSWQCEDDNEEFFKRIINDSLVIDPKLRTALSEKARPCKRQRAL